MISDLLKVARIFFMSTEKGAVHKETGLKCSIYYLCRGRTCATWICNPKKMGSQQSCNGFFIVKSADALDPGIVRVSIIYQ